MFVGVNPPLWDIRQASLKKKQGVVASIFQQEYLQALPSNINSSNFHKPLYEITLETFLEFEMFVGVHYPLWDSRKAYLKALQGEETLREKPSINLAPSKATIAQKVVEWIYSQSKKKLQLDEKL
jgi:hypothetical protein